MSETGQMGAQERVTWFINGGAEKVVIVVDRGKLVEAMLRALTGHGARKRATALYGAIVATREETK